MAICEKIRTIPVIWFRIHIQTTITNTTFSERVMNSNNALYYTESRDKNLNFHDSYFSIWRLSSMPFWPRYIITFFANSSLQVPLRIYNSKHSYYATQSKTSSQLQCFYNSMYHRHPRRSIEHKLLYSVQYFTSNFTYVNDQWRLTHFSKIKNQERVRTSWGFMGSFTADNSFLSGINELLGSNWSKIF